MYISVCVCEPERYVVNACRPVFVNARVHVCVCKDTDHYDFIIHSCLCNCLIPLVSSSENGVTCPSDVTLGLQGNSRPLELHFLPHILHSLHAYLVVPSACEPVWPSGKALGW